MPQTLYLGVTTQVVNVGFDPADDLVYWSSLSTSSLYRGLSDDRYQSEPCFQQLVLEDGNSFTCSHYDMQCTFVSFLYGDVVKL